MAIAFPSVAGASLPVLGSTDLVISKPSGTVEGDWMFCYVIASANVTISPPSGWTEDGAAAGIRGYRKKATGSEPSTYTITRALTTNTILGVIVRVTGAHPTTPIDTLAFQAGGTGTTVTLPSITVTDGFTLLQIAEVLAATSFTPPSGPTELFDQQFATQNFTGAVGIETVGAGSTGTRVWTAGASGNRSGSVYALRAAAPPSGESTGGWEASGTASGSRDSEGSASGDWEVSGTATGERDSDGDASGDHEWSGSAAGGRDAEGGATGAHEWAGSADGEASYQGSASGDHEWSGSASGDTEREGSASGGHEWAGVASGSSPNNGSAVGGHEWSGTASGDNGDQSGSAVGGWEASGAASGEREPKGAATGSHEWSGTATGIRDYIGSAVGGHEWSGEASGDRESAGVASGGHQWSGSASGTSNVPDIPRTPRATIKANRAKASIEP